jgi:mannitol/fructose-specific phosphotransferase system IIA component (Ntr-type)
MMQAEEVRQRFTQIEQTIHQASQACERAGSNVPTELKDSIQQLDQQSTQARQQLQNAKDDQQIIDCVDKLEELGDKAKAECEKGSNVDQQLKKAVMQAHQELSQLKHQLH